MVQRRRGWKGADVSGEARCLNQDFQDLGRLCAGGRPRSGLGWGRAWSCQNQDLQDFRILKMGALNPENPDSDSCLPPPVLT